MIEIRGAGLDSLVMSLELSRNLVRHVWNPSGQVGGHFGGWTTHCDRSAFVDSGMVLLEVGTEQSGRRTLDEYRLETHDRARPFIWNVYEWLSEVLNLQLEAHDVRSVFRNQDYSDYFVSDNLGVLEHLEESERKQIRRELQSIISDPASIHPSTKNSNNAWLGVSLADGLPATIGPTAVEILFGDFLRAFGGGKTLPFSDHRTWWLPAFWPETLLDALDGKFSLPPSRFHRPRNATVAAMVAQLAERALNSESRIPQASGVEAVRDFSASTVKSGDSLHYTLVHFCVDMAPAKTEFFASAPLGVVKLSSYPAEPAGLPRDYTRSTIVLELPNTELSAGTAEFETLVGWVESVGYRTLCSGAVRRARLPSGPLNRKPAGPSQNFNDSVLRGLKHAVDHLGSIS